MGLVTDSLERASALHGDPTQLIYARLFAQRSELESLFVLDRSGLIRGNMLAHVFNALIDMDGPRTYGLQFFRNERVTHEGGLGVTAEDYQCFLIVVRDTIRAIHAVEWNSDIDAAWNRLLAEIAA